MDYAMRNGVSLSTLRRHIKANKIPYKIENGRYLVLDEDARVPGDFSQGHGAILASHPNKTDQTASLVRDLNHKLQQAQEEIAELKTLIALYEEKIPSQKLSS